MEDYLLWVFIYSFWRVADDLLWVFIYSFWRVADDWAADGLLPPCLASPAQHGELPALESEAKLPEV